MINPSAGFCMKTAKPKNTVIGLSYLTHEDEFPMKMKEIIAKNFPFS